MTTAISKNRRLKLIGARFFKNWTSCIFVERSSTKDRSHHPPPNLETIAMLARTPAAQPAAQPARAPHNQPHNPPRSISNLTNVLPTSFNFNFNFTIYFTINLQIIVQFSSFAQLQSKCLLLFKCRWISKVLSRESKSVERFFFKYYSFISLFNTQTMHIKFNYTQQHCYVC
jgi:hypothetical protein